MQILITAISKDLSHRFRFDKAHICYGLAIWVANFFAVYHDCLGAWIITLVYISLETWYLLIDVSEPRKEWSALTIMEKEGHHFPK